MPLIQLETGKTIFISAYQYYFELEDEDVEEFLKACVADDLGIYTDNPFSDAHLKKGMVEVKEEPGEVVEEEEDESKEEI